MNVNTWHNGQIDGANCIFCRNVMPNIHSSHNPFPIKDEYKHGRCCGTCNVELVIPARIRQFEKAIRRGPQRQKKRRLFRV